MVSEDFSPLKSPSAIATMQSATESVDENAERFGESVTRFVAGENHMLYGSLRKGGAVRFFSRECAGLCAATIASLFSYYTLQGITRPVLAIQLKLTPQELLAVQRLAELPMALVFLMGMLSDCRPVFGVRRKAYMVIGLVLNAAMTIIMGGISLHIESKGIFSRDEVLIMVVTLLTSVASFGAIMTYLSVHTRIIELSQQEPLTVRGSIQASYMICRRVTSIATNIFTYGLLGDEFTAPRTTISTAVFLCAVVSLLPLPIILKHWDEELYSLSVPFRVRSKIVWKVMKQKAVWRTIAFIVCFALFLSIKFADSSLAVTTWAGAASDNTLALRVLVDAIMLFVVIIWRYVFMNRPWRSFYMWAPVFQIVPAFIVSALVAYDVTRNRYLYRALMSLTNVSDAIVSITLLVPLTEIVQEGSEGSIVGLVLSLQRLILIYVSTNQHGLFQGANFFTQTEVALDTSHVRDEVFRSLVLNYAVNALSVFGLLFLPTQKLDAQQMRMYGGFTKLAASGMVVFGCILFLYCMGVGMLTFIPATACSRIAGGPGC